MTRHSIWFVGGEDMRLRMPFYCALRELGFEVTVVATEDPEPYRQRNIRYHRYTLDRFLNPIKTLASLQELSRILALGKPDIVHGFDTKPSLLAPLAVAHRGVGCSVRTINGMGYVFSSRSAMALALRPVYRSLQRYVARKTAITIFQNQDDWAYFKAKGLVSPARSRVIPGSGVDIAGFLRMLPDTGATEAFRASLGLVGKRVVTVVSRLTRHKGINSLLMAADVVCNRNDQVVFVLVGPRRTEGRFAVPLSNIERRHPYVRYLGPRDDVPKILALTDVFVLPTEYREGVPRVLLEAGLAGCAIVTTTMPGCADVVRDKWNGLIVEPGDPEALASSIEHLLERPELRQVMGARSQSIITERFSLDRVVEDHAAVYEDVLRGGESK